MKAYSRPVLTEMFFLLAGASFLLAVVFVFVAAQAVKGETPGSQAADGWGTFRTIVAFLPAAGSAASGLIFFGMGQTIDYFGLIAHNTTRALEIIAHQDELTVTIGNDFGKLLRATALNTKAAADILTGAQINRDT